MLWYTSQTATLRRVNILGDLYVSPVIQSPGKCQNPCTQSQRTINLIPGVANGFVMANSVVTGKVINGDGLNRPGVEGIGGNSDIYFQQDDIGGYSGFGSDMVFAGTLGAPATDFGPGVEGPNGTFAVTPGHITTVDTVPVVREAAVRLLRRQPVPGVPPVGAVRRARPELGTRPAKATPCR